MSSTNEEVVRSYYAFADAGDLEGILSIFRDDAVYERPGLAPMNGREALRAFYAGPRLVKSGAHTLERVVTHDDIAIAQGELNGELQSGESIRARFVDVYEISDGLVKTRTTYFFSALI